MNAVKNYEITFPKESDTAVLQLAAQLVNSYAEQGLMLSLSLERLQGMAANGLLAIAVHGEQVIGTAAITFAFPDGKQEFGGWAVAPDWKHTGVGKTLLTTLLKSASLSEAEVIAFGNTNSGPIFTKYGAGLLDQNQMHPDAFVPCQLCKCDKSGFGDGQLCADLIYNLSPIRDALHGKGEA